MIELRTLYYFAAVCRSGNLTLAARSLGVALSTLSQSLKSLNAAFGQDLFRRGDGGLHPTGLARHILRAADALLLAERAGRSWMKGSNSSALRIVDVDIRLSFTMGGISAGIMTAADMLGERHPDVLVNPCWKDERDIGALEWSRDAGLPAGERVVIGLGVPSGERAPRSTVLLADAWGFALRYPQGTADRPSASSIARGRIVVPRLVPPLLEQAHRHLHKIGLRNVRFLQDHPGDLPKILAENADAALFVPLSLVTPRLGLSDVMTVAPEKPLVSRIVGYAPEPSLATRAFLVALKHALQERPAAMPPAPAFTRRDIDYFITTNRYRRVSAAARSLGLSQPSLSEHLQKLERLVGERLFERHAGGVSLTPFGQRFAQVADLIGAGFARLSQSNTSAHRTMSRRVSLGILPSVHQHGYLVNRVADALIEVQARWPDLTLAVQEAPNTVLQEWVMRGTVGLAIVETALPHMPRLPLGSSEALAAVVDARHDLLPPGPVKLAELLAKPLAVPGNRLGLRHLLEAAAQSRGLKIEASLEIDALPLVAALLARMPICAVLPPSAIERELAEGELSVHRIVEPTIQRKLFVIYSAERTLSEAERDLVQTLRRKLAGSRTAGRSIEDHDNAK